MRQSDDDLLAMLRKVFKSQADDIHFTNAEVLVLIIWFPKLRRTGEPIEASDVWAFALNKSVKNIGIEIGAWAVFENKVAPLIVPDGTRNGLGVGLDLLNPVFQLTKAKAAKLNNVKRYTGNIVCIGAGALGSQTILNLVRSGFGQWTIVDNDVLLPHNLARHALDGVSIGWPKALAIADVANSIYNNAADTMAIDANYLHPEENEPKLNEALSQAEVVLDLSASGPVSRELAFRETLNARCLSAFLNPMGSDLVLLVEDSTRSVRLDYLEVQYYRAILHDPLLEKHLQGENDRIRYGRSCRDITSNLPQELVAFHAAVASRGIRRALEQSSPAISIWQSSNDMTSNRIEVPVKKSRVFRIADWDLYIDEGLINLLYQYRTAKLPNETGGVLNSSLPSRKCFGTSGYDGIDRSFDGAVLMGV